MLLAVVYASAMLFREIWKAAAVASAVMRKGRIGFLHITVGYGK